MQQISGATHITATKLITPMRTHIYTHTYLRGCAPVVMLEKRAIWPQTATFATALATSTAATAATLLYIVSLISVIMQMQSVSGIKIGFNVALGITAALSWVLPEMQLLLLQQLHVTVFDNGGCRVLICALALF